LVEDLGISTGSVSTQMKVLAGIGFVEKITFPGDRSTYHQLKPDVWVKVMWSEVDQLERMMAISEAGSSVVPEERPDRLSDVGLIARFFLDKWPNFMDELIEYLEKERPNG
jgi:DNA-binding transcriptional regulator GbsR (MarR family)